MNSNQLPVNEYSKFQSTYINAAMNVELFDELEISLHDFIRFVQNIPMDKFDYRYAEGYAATHSSDRNQTNLR